MMTILEPSIIDAFKFVMIVLPNGNIYQPPQNSIALSEDINNILEYSPKKNKAKGSAE